MSKGMSERSFFDHRYVYPAFTFLIACVFTNIGLVIQILLNTEISGSSIIVGILSLLGVSSMGILLGLFWHLILNLFRMKFLRASSRWILEYNYSSEFKLDINYYRIIVEGFFIIRNLRLLYIRDYLLHYIIYSEKNQSTRNFLERRWDFLNTIGSGMTSYIMGLIMGYYLNAWYKGHIQLWYSNNNVFSNLFMKMVHSFYPTCIFGLFNLLLMIVSLFTLWWINKERQNNIITIFEQMNITKEEIESGFSRYVTFEVKAPVEENDSHDARAQS